MKLRLYHKTLIALHLVLILAIIFGSVGLYLIGTQVNDTLASIKQNSNDLHDALIVINRPRTGTIAGLNQTIFGADALLKQTNGIINHEERQLTTLDTQELSFFNDFHGLANKAGNTVDNLSITENAAAGTLNETTKTLAIINDKETGIGTTIRNINKTVADTDSMMTDTHVQAFIDNLEPLSKNAVAISGNVAGITNNLDATTTDFQHKFHTWIYPEPCKTASCKWGKVLNFALDVSKFAEPLDFAAQAYSNIKK